MSRSGNALDGAVRWDAHLDRPTGSPPGEIGQERTDGITEHRRHRRPPGVKGIKGGGDRG